MSTRFQGTDGVTLEAAKWAEIFESMGHCCFWFSGLSDRAESHSFVEPEAFFGHPKAREIDEKLWDRDQLSSTTQQQIASMRQTLRQALEDFGNRFHLDLIVAQNALTIPMQIPLGLALKDWLAEKKVPAIAHHHDFFWERERFRGGGVQPFLDEAFPPSLPDLQHVVINSEAARELERRKGLPSVVLPNVMNFSGTPPEPSRPLVEIRQLLDFTPEDHIFLQPTRIIPRKGIEHAIDLLAARGNAHDKLLVSHQAGDEGFAYLSFLREKARSCSVDFRCIDDSEVPAARSLPLWDLYHIADFVTYPSLYEGFGNALLETFAFRKPILVNRYSVFLEDIEPHGFQVAKMDGIITPETVGQVERLLSDKAYSRHCTETNFNLAKQHFGYPILEKTLAGLLDQSSPCSSEVSSSEVSSSVVSSSGSASSPPSRT